MKKSADSISININILLLFLETAPYCHHLDLSAKVQPS